MSKISPEGIYVTAQQYKLRHRMRPAAVGRWLAEKVFSEFGDKMKALAIVDQKLRETALGGNEFNISIKDALAKGKESLKAGRYIDAAYYASVINEIIIAIILESQDAVRQLRTLGQEYHARTEAPSVEFFEQRKQVEAQMLQKIWRGIWGDPMEKAWKKEIAKRQAVFNGMMLNVERYVTELLGIFDRMGIARASGKIEDWMSEYDRIYKSQPRYQAYLDQIYDKEVKTLLEVAKRMQREGELGSADSLAWLSSLFGGVTPSGTVPASKEKEAPGRFEPSEPSPQQEAPRTTPAGHATEGIPVSPGVVEQAPASKPTTEAEPEIDVEEDSWDLSGAQQQEAGTPQVKPEKPRRGRGRPRKEPSTLQDITEDQFAQLKEALQNVRKEQAQVMAGVIEAVLRGGGADEIIQNGDGEVVAQTQNGVITFYGIEGPDGEDIQIPVPLVFKALRQMQVAGLLPAKPTNKREPGAKPIPMGGEVHEEEHEPKLLGPIPGKEKTKKRRGRPKKKQEPISNVTPIKAPEEVKPESRPEPEIKSGPRKLKPAKPGARKGLMVAIGDKELMQKMRADPKAKRRFLDELKQIYMNQHPEVTEDFSVYIAPPDQVEKEAERYKKRGTYDEVVLDAITYEDLVSTPAVSAKVNIDDVDRAVLKLSNNRFYRALEQTAQLNDPYLIATLMLKYSKKIEDLDPVLSVKLFAQAQEIIDG